MSLNNKRKNMTTVNTSIVERPEGTLSASYIRSKNSIKRWRENNKEYLRKYNREYQRQLRKDPVKCQETYMRIHLRKYLTGGYINSYKIITSLGMTREELLQKLNITRQQFLDMLETHEVDHIIPYKWFNDPKNIHLKPYAYRHYNMQFVPKKSNRSKHCWIDEEDSRIQYVITRMKLDYMNTLDRCDKEFLTENSMLSKKAHRLYKEITK